MEQTQKDVEENTSGNFDETPSEMYRRIAKKPEVKTETKPKEKINNVQKVEKDPPEKKPINTSKQSEPIKKADESRKVSHPPADVPAGKTILVTLQEDLSSEEKERDGKTFRLTCNEDVIADNRVIIRKGATVTGKIVDCVPSNSRKKALIGFVILRVEAVDGSTVRLKSKRFRLYADAPGKPIHYRPGETFEAILQRGRVE